MLINSKQLDNYLNTNVNNKQNLYFLFGAEPLLIQQSSDKILSHIKNNKASNFKNKFVFDVDVKFDFANLNDELVARDLFTTEKIIKINVSALAIKITKNLTNIVNNIKDGVIVILVMGKLTTAQQKSKWFEFISSKALTISHLEIYPNQMQNWVLSQMQEVKLTKNIEIAQIIAQNNEGNLLGANNEIQKLKFIYGKQEINTQEFIKQSQQMSIYSIYSLIDNALLGNIVNVNKIYNNLKIDEIYLLTMLYNQITQLIDIHLKIKKNITINIALKEAGVWSSKTNLITTALKHHSYPILQKMLLKLGRIDRSIKGLDEKNTEQELRAVLLSLAGVKTTL